MKFLGKLGATAAISVVAAAGFVTPASAASQPEVHVYTASSGVEVPAALIGENGEKPTEWGVAEVSLASAGTITPMATKSVGGGTWSYGTGSSGATGKSCYSNYIHPTKKHSGSIAIGAVTDKDTQAADIWAKAYGTAGASHTCYTYWGVY